MVVTVWDSNQRRRLSSPGGIDVLHAPAYLLPQLTTGCLKVPLRAGNDGGRAPSFRKLAFETGWQSQEKRPDCFVEGGGRACPPFPVPFFHNIPANLECRVATGSYLLSLPKMLSGANAFEISDIERMNIEGASAGGLGRNNVTCPVVTRNNNSPGTGGGPDFKVR